MIDIRNILRTAAIHESNGEPEKALAHLDKVAKLSPFPDILSCRIFMLDFIQNASVERQQAARRFWWDKIGSWQPRTLLLGHDINPNRKLVIGYVSADFRHHSAATGFGPVIAFHDRDQFEVVCYHNTQTQDETTAWFKEKGRFVDVSRLSDNAMVRQIEYDKVDILVDLSGHTAGNRLSVFSRKPAPVQVTAWGHVTGTGIPTIDYMFADAVLIPQAIRHLFSERIYDLPCGVVSEPPPLPIVDPPCLKREYVTFGMFNRPTKMTDASLAVWAKILKAVPSSRLLIKAGGFKDPAKRVQVRAKLTGVLPQRIEFMSETKNPEHLAAAQEHVDIMLDPLPMNGGVTSWETLYCGIPLVSLLGETAPGRIGAAILTAIGKPEWIANSIEHYVEIAVRLASNHDELRKYRHDLAASMRVTEAGDMAKYTKHVERAYRAMWMEYCAKKAKGGTEARDGTTYYAPGLDPDDVTCGNGHG